MACAGVVRESAPQTVFPLGRSYVLLSCLLIDQHVDSLHLPKAFLPARVDPGQVMDVDAELAEPGEGRFMLIAEGSYRLGLPRSALSPGPGAWAPVHDQTLFVLIEPVVADHGVAVVASDVDIGESLAAPRPASSHRQDLIQAD